MKITEAKIERKVTDFCRKEKLYCRKFASPAQRGVPDRLIVGPKGALFLELKRPGNEPTDLQRRELRLIRASGGVAMWSDSAEVSIRAIKHYCRGEMQPIAFTMDMKVINPMEDDRVPKVKTSFEKKLLKMVDQCRIDVRVDPRDLV